MNNITPIFTLIGILVGWILTQLAQWYKGKKEDNRLRKEVLFYLLEFRFIIPKLNLTSFVDLISEKIVLQLPKQYQTPEIKIEIAKVIPVHGMLTLLKSRIKEPFLEAEKNYKDAVHKLASVDPIMAYELSGQTNMIEYAEQVIGYIKTIPEDGSDTFNAPAFKEFLSTTINNKTFEECVKSLDEFIKELSFNISIPLWIRAKKKLKRIELTATFDEEDNKFINEMFKKLNLSDQLVFNE